MSFIQHSLWKWVCHEWDLWVEFEWMMNKEHRWSTSSTAHVFFKAGSLVGRKVCHVLRTLLFVFILCLSWWRRWFHVFTLTCRELWHYLSFTLCCPHVWLLLCLGIAKAEVAWYGREHSGDKPKKEEIRAEIMQIKICLKAKKSVITTATCHHVTLMGSPTTSLVTESTWIFTVFTVFFCLLPWPKSLGFFFYW